MTTHTDNVECLQRAIEFARSDEVASSRWCPVPGRQSPFHSLNEIIAKVERGEAFWITTDRAEAILAELRELRARKVEQ